MSGRRPRAVALFSHDSQGLGHVRRNIEIAAALVRDDADVETLLISGAPGAGSLPLPSRTRLVTIPAVRKDARGRYVSQQRRHSLRATLAERGARTAAAVRELDPDVLVVDKHARGLFGELDTTLAEIASARADGRGPALVLGLRDVLDDPETTRREWDAERTTETVLTHYDQVWVYSDRTVHDPVLSYGFGPELADRVRYTGYLGRGRGAGLRVPAQAPVPAQPFVLGLLGGGQDGAALAREFAEASAPRGYLKILVTGPYLDRATLRRLQRTAAGRPGDLLVLPFLASTQPFVRRARAVVTMGGYNTVCEVLESGTPALVVPRVRPRREQAIRAELLAATTHLDSMHPDLARSDRLADWLAGAVRRPRRRHDIDLDGLARLPQLVGSLVASRAGAEVARAHA